MWQTGCWSVRSRTSSLLVFMPSAILCCDSIELKKFGSCSIPDTGSCYTLRNIWLWNYWISSCSVTTQTSNALLLTRELKYTDPLRTPQCITLTVARVVIAFRCRHTKHMPNFTSCSSDKFREMRVYSLYPQVILLYPFSAASSFSSPKSPSLQPLPSGTAFLFLCIPTTFQFSADKILPLLLMSLNFFLSHWPYD